MVSEVVGVISPSERGHMLYNECNNVYSSLPLNLVAKAPNYFENVMQQPQHTPKRAHHMHPLPRGRREPVVLIG
jgi:hypothetical protein